MPPENLVHFPFLHRDADRRLTGALEGLFQPLTRRRLALARASEIGTARWSASSSIARRRCPDRERG
jgi:hypothetical protein